MTDDEQLELDGLGGEEPEDLIDIVVPAEAERPSEGAPEPPLNVDPLPEPTTGETPAPTAELTPSEVETQTYSEPEATVEPALSVAAATAEEPAAVPAPAPWYFLTNRMNLNGLLSSRLLAPRESFHKYYADLLELSPGWVPILAGPPPRELVERVVAEEGAGAPVLVELAEDVLGGDPPARQVLYVRAAPLSGAKAIHFREEKSLREHRARGYSNVFPDEERLKVSPDLFTGEGPEVVIAAPSEEPAMDWSQIDRTRGAVSAALAAADSGEALAVTAGLLGACSLPSDTVLPPWLNWNGLVGDGVAPASEGDAERADRLIFQSAYRVLGERDQAESWSPSEALEAVVAQLAAAEPSDEVNAIIQRNLQRVRELVNVEQDFEPFRNPGSPYVAAKSFLMVLLRPDLGQLLEWPAEESGADETTRVVAAVLAGRLRGVARESVKLRNVVLDDLTAAWAVRASSGHASALGMAEFVAGAGKASLILGGIELKATEALVPDSATVYEALSVSAQHSARVSVSRQLGWPVTDRVHFAADADIQVEDSAICITSTESVRVETVVDESAFVARLRSLGARSRRLVNQVLDNSR